MSALVLLPGEGKAIQIGGGGLGVVFKLFGLMARDGLLGPQEKFTTLSP
jgi:hypothetical protein